MRAAACSALAGAAAVGGAVTCTGCGCTAHRGISEHAEHTRMHGETEEMV